MKDLPIHPTHKSRPEGRLKMVRKRENVGVIDDILALSEPQHKEKLIFLKENYGPGSKEAAPLHHWNSAMEDESACFLDLTTLCVGGRDGEGMYPSRHRPVLFPLASGSQASSINRFLELSLFRDSGTIRRVLIQSNEFITPSKP